MQVKTKLLMKTRFTDNFWFTVLLFVVLPFVVTLLILVGIIRMILNVV